ncbi:MFS transporter [Aquabacterium sp. A7-Y]|uniref:MFS transporter n=1 Tax=Aquabacterium sp. A7-Y TaxID=1349605 RepID=UPI00223CC09C|nr:MFS transporter [Aquabacterium sp. A7-Y]MCW7538199.1 MFS transporter [Aquabacterium sp. A7-Y]
MGRDVLLFVAYRVVSRLYFHLPILFLLFWSLQLRFPVVMVLVASYSAASTFTSDLAPRLSRRFRGSRVVAAGELLKSVGLAGLIVGTLPGAVSFELLLLSQVVGGAGFAISLSADNALLRSLSNSADPKAFAALQARTQSAMFVATLVAGSLGSVLFDHEAHYPLYAGIAASLASIVLVLTISDAPPPATASSAPTAPAPLRLDADQLYWVRFYAVTRAFAMAPFLGLIPLYFTLQQVDPYLFGAVLGLFTLGGFGVALSGLNKIDAEQARTAYSVLLAGLLASLLCFALSVRLDGLGLSYFASGLIGIALLGVSAGAIRPVVMARLDLSSVPPPQRVAVFAAMERLFGYLCAGLLLVAGPLVEQVSLEAGFGFIVAGLLGAVAVLETLRARPTPSAPPVPVHQPQE